MMRRWNEDIGNRSRRAPAFTRTVRSLLPRQHSQAAHGQGLGGQAAVLVEGILQRGLKKFLAVPRGRGIEAQDAFDEVIDIRRQCACWADVRDQADLPRLSRSDGIAE